MEPFGVEDLIRERADGDRYTEFIRRDSMSVGVYGLPRNGIDRQTPHGEDEIYYLVSGKAKIEIGDMEYRVEEGDVVFVEREVEHRFFDIEEPIEALVVFAPAEGTSGGD